MTAFTTPLVGDPIVFPSRLETVARAAEVDEPTLILDTEQVVRSYRRLATGLGRARIHYAMKANPTPEVLDVLHAEGSAFDAASRGEIALLLSRGVPAQDISFGNTVKKPGDIAFAWDAGVTLFAADCEEELEKIAEHAPGADIYIRLLVGATGADWPLSRKFGCTPDMAITLLHRAAALGLNPVGLSFHVGSQTRRSEMWEGTLRAVAEVWDRARAEGIALHLLNLGGGFPAFYGEAIDAPEVYGAAIMAMVERFFAGATRVMAEPGRGLVAEAGMIVAEVVTVSKKAADDLHRWVYLDIGRFSGLAETEGEAIRYQLVTARDGEETGPCVLAGPSCDSADVLYEKRPVALPLGLRSGDRVLIRNCGAYTSSYSSVGFNGFPPLAVEVI